METIAKYNDLLIAYAIAFGGKLIGAIVLWIVGGWAINLLGSITHRTMTVRNVDPTLVRYSEGIVRVALRIALIIAILGVFGIETTSFAALLAAAGIAIGAAWSGLLANFAAGTFLMILRPFKVGDMITAGGVTGDVTEIGVFATTLHTADNLKVFVGNNKIFSDNIVNYTQNPVRRVDLTAQLAHGVNTQDAIARLKAEVAKVANVVTTPAPSVEILAFNAAGTQLAVRPSCANKDYWQVYFDTNKAIQRVGETAGWPTPAPVSVHIAKG